jgi:hypothetical protein
LSSILIKYKKYQSIAKGGLMKRVVIAVAAVLSLVFAVTVFAVEGNQPSKEAGPSFEQMKDDHLKKLDARMTSLQQEKTCVQAANNQDDLKTCRAKHRAEMQGQPGEMRKRGGPGGLSDQVPPQRK